VTDAEREPVKETTKPNPFEGDLTDIPRYTPVNGTPTLDNWLQGTMTSQEKKVKQTNNSTVEEYA
jgi:hypothetical protein